MNKKETKTIKVDPRGKKAWAFPLAFISAMREEVPNIRWLLIVFALFLFLPNHFINITNRQISGFFSKMGLDNFDQIITSLLMVFAAYIAYKLFTSWQKASAYIDIARKGTSIVGRVEKIIGKKGNSVLYKYTISGNEYEGTGLHPKHSDYRFGDIIDLVALRQNPEYSLPKEGFLYNALRTLLGLMSEAEFKDAERKFQQQKNDMDRFNGEGRHSRKEDTGF